MADAFPLGARPDYYRHIYPTSTQVSRAVTWNDFYADQLQATRARPGGAVYATGLRRGFEGAGAVSDPEHERLLRDGDWRTSWTYREGLLTGMNLRVWSTWFGPPT